MRRLGTSLILIPLAILAVLALFLAYKIHAGNKAVAMYPPIAAGAPLSSSSILIFSPHPDDETLGAGGLIQETLRAGGKVHVAFMTNGDSFRVGVADYYKVLQVPPADYIKYGKMRQGESLRALATLGLPSSDIVFLGYPDRGLMRMWETSWLPSSPWTSPYSQASINPYPNAPSFGKPYCGVNVLADVEAQIVKDHPTDIYVTHPTDDHPDHSASASFVVAAIHALIADGDGWAGHIAIHYFLIHRGDWPVPQGYYPTMTIAPPAAFIGLDTCWQSLDLTSRDVTVKKSALDRYVSQEEMMSRFLVSFIRKNEIFGDLPESQQSAEQDESLTNTVSADPAQWPRSKSFAKDPIGDSVLRGFQPGGDIRELFGAYDSNNLYVTMSLHSPLSKEITYHLAVRPFDGAMNTIPGVITYNFTPRNVGEAVTGHLQNGASVIWSGTSAEFTIPFKSLTAAKPRVVFVQGSTTFARVVVDHTGYRPMFLTWAARTAPLS